MFDALAPAIDTVEAELARGSDLAAALAARHRGSRSGARRHHPDARAQGAGQLPRRTQRRPPGSGRHLGGALDRGSRGGPAGGLVMTGDGVGIVVVSHSRALARAAIALAEEMLHGRPVRIEVAAGLDGRHARHGRGARSSTRSCTPTTGGASSSSWTWAVPSSPRSSPWTCSTAALRERVILCPAPLVEGLCVAAVAAGTGADRDGVATEALRALGAKEDHLSAPAAAPGPDADGDGARRRRRRAGRQVRGDVAARAARASGRGPGAGRARVRRGRAAARRHRRGRRGPGREPDPGGRDGRGRGAHGGGDGRGAAGPRGAGPGAGARGHRLRRPPGHGRQRGRHRPPPALVTGCGRHLATTPPPRTAPPRTAPPAGRPERGACPPPRAWPWARPGS